jgi:hypothetical protein
MKSLVPIVAQALNDVISQPPAATHAEALNRVLEAGREPQELTPDDELWAWRAFYNDPASEPFRDPRPEDATDQLTMAGLRRALEQDRQRVANQLFQAPTSARGTGATGV